MGHGSMLRLPSDYYNVQSNMLVFKSGFCSRGRGGVGGGGGGGKANTMCQMPNLRGGGVLNTINLLRKLLWSTVFSVFTGKLIN